MGLTDGHLAWGDDIPTESEKIFYRQIAELEKENARLLKDCEVYKKAIEDIKKEIKSKKFKGYVNDNGSVDLPDHQAHFNSGLILALEIIDKHTSGAKMEEVKE